MIAALRGDWSKIRIFAPNCILIGANARACTDARLSGPGAQFDAILAANGSSEFGPPISGLENTPHVIQF
jgi:hypothetical protein